MHKKLTYARTTHGKKLHIVPELSVANGTMRALCGQDTDETVDPTADEIGEIDPEEVSVCSSCERLHGTGRWES